MNSLIVFTSCDVYTLLNTVKDQKCYLLGVKILILFLFEECIYEKLKFLGAQFSNSVLGRPSVDVSRSQTIRHTQPIGLLWTSDRPVVEITTYTTHNKYNGRKCMPSAGFELMFSTGERPRDHWNWLR